MHTAVVLRNLREKNCSKMLQELRWTYPLEMYKEVNSKDATTITGC